MVKERFKTMGTWGLLLVFGCFIAFADCAKTKSMFKFTRPLYVATMPENARGRVYAVPVEGRMGVSLPWSGVIAQPQLASNRNRGSSTAGVATSSENATAHQFHSQQAHHQSLVRFRIVSSDKHNFFKAESEIVGDFAYLRIRIRSSLDVDLNRELTPEFSLRVKAVYRRQAAGFSGGGGGRNLETRAEVLLKITDQNDLSPVFLPEHYRAKIDRRTPMFSSVTRVTASDGDIGLNGEVYYQLMNQTDYFAVHPTSGVVSLIRPLSDLPSTSKYFNLSIAAVDRASRLFSDSRNNLGPASLASVNVDIIDDNVSSKQSSWIVKTSKDDGERFGTCGTVPDGLCATVRFTDDKTPVERLELGDSSGKDDAAKYFYVHRPGKHRRVEEGFEIRSISTTPAGLYNLTLLPVGLSVLLNVSAFGGLDASCDDKDLDIWMNRMDFTFEVPEWAPDGYLVGDIRLDPKAGATNFELRKADEETEKTLPFEITSGTGILYLKQIENETSALNYGRRSTYEFFVHVRRTKCRPEREEKRKVIVRLKDCNDHAPKFTDTCDRIILDLTRLPSNDVSLCKFIAVDEDMGENGKISFDIPSSTTTWGRFFNVDHDRGELVLRNSSALLLDMEKNGKISKNGKALSFVVRAFDHGWPLKRVTQKTVTVSFNESGFASGTSDRWTVESGENNQRELVQENRHSPVVASEWSFEIEENAPIGRSVGIIQASDLDSGYAGVLLFTIEQGQPESPVIKERPFDIDLYNGSIFVFRALDREKRDEYSFNVSIRDLGNPSRHAITKVVVKILDVNDNPPKFEKPTYRLRLKENAEIGSSILQLRAFDDDSEGNGRVRYSLVTRTPFFNVDAQSGVLTLKSELDRERIDRHRLLIQAQDYGQPPLSALVNVTVIVEDVNDNAPVCRTKSLKAYVSEDYPAGALVTCVDADDPDNGENGRISYRLVDGARKSINSSSDVPFFIDSATGCIRLAWPTTWNSKQRKAMPSYSELILDYERQPFYNLTVELSDFGSPRPLKNTCNVFVEVVGVNENRFPPKFVNFGDFGVDDDEPVFAVEAEIYENEVAPTFVRQLKAIDPDAPVNMPEPKIIYSIMDGDGLGIFTIDQEGRIHANRSLDRETKPFYWLIVTATDRAPAPLSSSVDVFVRVLDRNDNSPVPSKSIYYASVMENSPPNTVVLRVEATDADLITTPIPQMDGEEDDEREQETEIKPPPMEFSQLSSPLTYKITGGDPQSFFKIDSKTGDITTHRRMLDRETTPELELEVTISDNGEPEPLITTVTVVVRVEDENDHPPVFPSKMMNYDIPERSKRQARNNGKNRKHTFLCRVFAVDEDEGKNGEIRYAITEGNEQNIVRIDPDTGSIFAMENSTWNDSQQFILTVRASDSGIPPKSSERHLHLTVVSDETDAKAVDSKSIKILSNLVANPLHISAVDPIGHRVGLIEAALEDGVDERRIWFYLLEGNVDNAFALRPDTGVLLLAKKPTLTTYTLTFLATVDGINGVEGQATVIVQPVIEDERPQFSHDPIQIRVSENQSANSVLLRLPEFLKSTYDREEIRFFLSDNYYVHNSSNAGNDGIFQLDAKSGAIFLKQALDREHQARYLFRIGARSRRGRIGYAIIDVHVIDVNDHAPEFINRHVQLRISQMTNPGTVIHQMTAFDGDEGANGRLTYSLTMGNYKDAFTIDSHSGALRLLRSLTKADLTTEFVLTVKAEDGGRPPLFDTATVRILLASNIASADGSQVTGVVHFTQDVYTFRASEKLPIGGLVGHVQADGLASVEYGMLEDSGGYFNVHPLTGAVTLRRAFDFEQSTHIEATAKAWSPSSIPATAEGTARLVVTLTDGNDHGPVFKKLYHQATVEENSPTGTVVLIVEATDADTGQGGVVTYHIVEEWARQYFDIDPHTGAIRLMQSLDYEREGQQKFEFRVSAEDLGDPTMYSVRPALVEIKVLDVNDLPPVFESKTYEFTIHTPAVPAMKIGQLEAIDRDTVGTVQFFLGKSPPCWQLDIDRVSGLLKLSRLWTDAKARNLTVFSCKIVATDGLHEVEADVNVKVEPYVQSATGLKLEESQYEIAILENSSDLVDGAVLARLRPAGVDPFEAISYKLLNADDEFDQKSSGPFIILNPSNGAVMATEHTRKIDREVTPTLIYLAEARMIRRPDVPPARTMINIRVLDINDNEPRFVGLPYSISVTVKAGGNQSVFRVKAMDPDDGANGRVKYSWAKGQQLSNLFRIDEESGEIFVNGDLKSLDKAGKRNLQLLVVASDEGSPVLSSTTAVSVRLVNASTPVFPRSTYNSSVHEGSAAVGTVLFDRNAFGVPTVTGAVLGYTIVENDDSADSTFFDIDFATGRLILRKPLDRKQKSVIKLPIRVRDYSQPTGGDDHQPWSDAIVEIDVLDYNDHTPVFEAPLYVVNISENASMSGVAPLAVFKATDEDEGLNSQITYELQSSSGQSESNFRLNPETGALTLAKRLDYEKQKKHVLTVLAKDFGSPSLSSTAKVHIHVLDANDNPPAFTQMAFEVEVPSPKWSAGQFLGQALASDPDECDRGRLRYSIFSGNDGDWFKIDERSGVLRTARASSLDGFMIPSPEYPLVLTVTDGVHSASCKFLVKIRQGSAFGMTKFAKAVYQARVKERSSPGTFVTEVRVEDRAGSAMPTLRYRLVGSSVFRMEETTGKVFTSRQLDASTKPIHYLTILAEKWSDFTVVAHCRLQITVINENNRPPKFLADRFFATVAAETKPNSIVLKIRAIDLDRDDVLEYSMDSKSSSSFEEFFFLDSNTGALAVRRNLESVIGSVFKAVIRVTDRGNPPQRTTAPLEIRIVSEQAAAASQLVNFARLEYIYTVREDVMVGTEIGQLDVTRRGGGTGIGSQNYRFSIVTPRLVGTGVDWISLGERTGLLRIIEPMDREMTNELQFYVSSTRTGSKDTGSMALVRILIEDTDDNGPAFENASDNEPTVVTVAEDIPVGGMATIFAASDPDSGEAGRVTYWIEEVEKDSQSLPFKIDSETGWLRTTAELDRERQDTYNFKIVAGSVHIADLRATLNVTVKVADANDQKPVFEKKAYAFQLENGFSTLPGYVIGRVVAVDSDLPPNNDITYYLTGGNERGLFDIRGTGEIYLARKIEGDDQAALYRLTVLASDGTFEDATVVNVSVQMKSAVVCKVDKMKCPKSRSISVNEDEPVGKVIDRLPDLPAGMKYRMAGENGALGLDFSVKVNGDVNILRRLDYEKRKTYVADIEVIAAGKESIVCRAMECMLRLAINVQDVNDCAPQFDQETVANEIPIAENYNGTFPYFLGRVHATDADTGLSGQVRYRLSIENNEVEEKGLFTIDPVGGALFLWRPLDREHRDFYNLTIFATDGGHPKPMSSQRTIMIKVLDVNDNPPVFVQKSYDVSAPEDTPVGVVLVRVEAASADVGENAVITYSLDEAAGSAMFEIDAKTGEVRLRQPLDYEISKEHTVLVVATDGGKPPLSASVQLRLRVIDVNDNEPVFEKRHYTVRVPENAAIKSRIIRILASDADSEKNGLVSYRIEPANKYFQVTIDHQEPGWIVLTEGLDYEKMIRHEFQVMAYDQGQPSKSSVAVVTVDVTDVNDNAPKILNCNRTLVVKAHLPTTTPLVTLQATDPDGPSNGKPFHFDIVDSPVEGAIFKIDAHGAFYSLQTPLDRSDYHVKVSARDSGDPPMTSQCRLHISVSDESRFPPRLTNTSFLVLSYMGEMGSGGVIGRVIAVDDDPKDSVRYSIVNVSQFLTDGDGSYNDADRKEIREKEMFSVDPDDGRISAAAELQPGEYILNVSATDGRFDTFAAVTVSIRSITTKMLDSAVSLRISDRFMEEDNENEVEQRGGRRTKKPEPFDERVFVERHLKSLTRAIAMAVNARYARFVHILSVQKATDAGSEDERTATEGGKSSKKLGVGRVSRRATRREHRSRRVEDESSAGISKRATTGGVDVLIAVQKSRHHDYFKPEYVRKTLEQKLEEVERAGGVKVVSLVTETCRPERCKSGGVCRERLHLYEMVNNAILTETYSFVSPSHKRWAECVCADGYGGETCENEINQCAKRPCPAGRICVPTTSSHPEGTTEKTEKGYRCVCAGIGCPGFDSVHLMSPRSWIRYTLSENLEMEMRFAITFRTVARQGVLLFSGGRTDFQSLELFGGQLRYRYDLGDGETLVYVDGRPSVDDGQWHTVRLERKGRTAKLTLDNRQPQVANAPGDAFVLNLHGADVYLGSGQASDSGFVGCLKDATLNEDVLPWHGPGVQLYDVDVGLCTDDEFKRILTVAAGMKNTCGWCLNNGTCINGDPKQEPAWSCVCPSPFTGPRCETLITKQGPGGACSSSPCRNGGTCVLDKSSETGYRCQCPPGYVGRTCLVMGSDPCISNPCANGAACVKITSANGGIGFFCNCTSAWTGPMCRQAVVPSPNIVGGLLGITVPELIGIIAIFLVLILLTVVIVLLCRRQRSFRRKKFMQRRGPLSSGVKHGENEPMFSESDVTPSSFAQRQFGQNMLVSGGPCGAMVVVSDPNSSGTPISPAACSLPASFGNGSTGPPPLPPRSRGFQPHRGSKLSNLESALSTGIPTVQVRPLSMSERQSTPVDGGLARGAAGGYLETAANYGSAAEELERLGRRTSPSLDDLEDWKAALNRMNADSLEKLKAAAGITDDQYWLNDAISGADGACARSGGPPSSTGEQHVGAQSAVSIQCLPEDEKSSGRYHWDYSDWNSTIGHNGERAQAAAGPYATLSHLSVATDDEYGTGTLPRGVCRLEETDSEYAGNESGNEDHDTEAKTDSELRSRLRGDEFTKELIALTRAFGRHRPGNSDSDDGSSSHPVLSTFKSNGTNGNGGNSYLDRYLPRPVEPPNSTASERKLLLSEAGETTDSSCAVPDHFSDDDEEYTTPSAVCQSSLLDTSRISDIGGGASSDGERSTDSVVPASASLPGGVKREDSTLIVCSISEDEDEADNGASAVDQSNSGKDNNRTYSKKAKKQTQV